ncbi:MAG: hypothetical protein GC136_08420 [Alphaproteobacteria bacterium]|nr:hypothetical protein [Alphaproteobacteria bacterium]
MICEICFKVISTNGIKQLIKHIR